LDQIPYDAPNLSFSRIFRHGQAQQARRDSLCHWQTSLPMHALSRTQGGNRCAAAAACLKAFGFGCVATAKKDTAQGDVLKVITFLCPVDSRACRSPT